MLSLYLYLNVVYNDISVLHVSLLVKTMKSHAACYIVVLHLSSALVQAYKLVREAEHCIRQFAFSCTECNFLLQPLYSSILVKYTA